MASTSEESASERFVAAYWPTVGTNPLVRRLAELPWGLGFPVYLVAYVAKAWHPAGAFRYVLTSHRITTARGNNGPYLESVSLSNIASITVENERPFSRSGDLHIATKDGGEFWLLGIYAPEPARRTILQIAETRTSIDAVLCDRSHPTSSPIAPATAETAPADPAPTSAEPTPVPREKHTEKNGLRSKSPKPAASHS